jgi:formylglycine-generating enzyme required for sulfatase activity
MRQRVTASLVAAACAACSTRESTVGGLLVTMRVDGTFAAPATRLHLELSPPSGGAPYFSHDYLVPEDATLPASIGVRSNGDPGAAVVVEASLWSGATPLDDRRYEVRVPTASVEDVEVVFSPRCMPYVIAVGGKAESMCGATATCDPATGVCGSDVYSTADATVAGEGKDGAGGGDGASGGGGEAGSDAPAVDAADAGVACDPDAALGSCDGNVPLLCTRGRWVTAGSACVGGSVCQQGTCRPVPPSCAGTPQVWQCDSLEVPGGSFSRSFDDAGYGDPSFTATVSPFRLDKYEVTVSRFALFLTAVELGQGLPGAWAGKHDFLNGGRGLVVGTGDAGPVYESGWDPSWAAGIATTASGWDANLSCFPATLATATSPNPSDPINCITWFEAYAFCIWDGGFLPTEAEWNYAAAGGSEQRVFPWGATDPQQDASLAKFGCGLPGTCNDLAADIGTVNVDPGGAARWGQLNLAGNMAEWTLDWYGTYPMPCQDCSQTTTGAYRIERGGNFQDDETGLHASARGRADPTMRSTLQGIRCARKP